MHTHPAPSTTSSSSTTTPPTPTTPTSTSAAIASLTSQLRSLRESLQLLSGLQHLAQSTRTTFLESLRAARGLHYSRHILQSFPYALPQAGDCVADALLYNTGVRTDEEFYKLVYGVSWSVVLLLRHDEEIVEAINHRGDVFAQGRAMTEETEYAFEALVAWGMKRAMARREFFGAGLGGDGEAVEWWVSVMSG